MTATGTDSEALIAVPAQRAAALAGVSPRRLISWEAKDLLSPRTKRQISQRNTVRLYDFDELVQLRVIMALHEEGVSVRHIRRIVEYLKARYSYTAPLNQLVFAVSGKEVFFKHPDGTWEGDRRPGQIVLEHVLRLDVIREELLQRLASKRGKGEVGKIERRRKVLGSKPVFAGTRTPVEAVLAFIRSGHTDQEILEAFPHLTPADLKSARKLEQSA